MHHRHAFSFAAIGLAAAFVAPVRAQPTPEESGARPHLVLQTGPQESVTSVALAPDGRTVATGSFDGRVRVLDARTGALRLVIGADECRGVSGVAFAPDGRALAASGFAMDKAVRLWDPRTGALVRALAGHEGMETNAVAFAPDGRRLASAGRDGLVLVWDLETGALRHRLSGHDGAATAVAFAPDGHSLASGGVDRTVRLWDAATGQPRRSFRDLPDRVNALAFSPDGKSLAVGSSGWSRFGIRYAIAPSGDKGDCLVNLWETATGVVLWTLRERGRVSSLAFASDGTSLACGFGTGVRLVDARTGRSLGTVATHDNEVASVAFAPEGNAVVSGGHDRTVIMTALPSGERAWVARGYWEQVNSVALSPDGSLIASGSSDIRVTEGSLKPNAPGLGPGGVRLWDARTGRLLRRLGEPREQVRSVAFSPDGRWLAAGAGGPDGSGAVRLWDARTGAEAGARVDPGAPVIAIAFAPDGKTLASAGSDGRITLGDVPTAVVRRTLEGHNGAVTALAFSADGATLASGGSDQTARLWDTNTGRPIRVLHPEDVRGHDARPAEDAGGMFTAVALSPDGTTLAACSSSEAPAFGDRQTRLWDVRTGRLIQTFGRPQSRGRLAAFSPDGSTLATSGQGKAIALWDVKSGQLLRELIGHPHPALSAAFSADGRTLVSGADYRTVKVWDVGRGRPLAAFVTFSESRAGTGSDDWLAYTPDGSYDGSPDVDRFLAWRVGSDLRTADRMTPRLRRPDRLEATLKTRP
jgi:WD40 repeat protein